MTVLTRHALRVTAALAELRSANGDVLDALVPFFEPILAVLHGKVFEPMLLSAGVQKLYRWRFTRDVAEQFIPRLVRKGYLIRTGTRKEAIYTVNFTAEVQYVSEDNIAKKLSNIVDQFDLFVPRLTDLLHHDKSREELADILVRFLVSIEAYGEGVLAESLTQLKQESREAFGLIESLEEGGQPLPREDRYIAARFVSDLCEKDPTVADELTKIAAVGLLTEVVEDFVRPTSVASESDLTIIVDAPLALDYLGLSGVALQQDVRAVFEPLRKIGCRLVVFPITCDEMRRNLQSMLALPPARRHGYTHTAMVRGEVMPAFVDTVAHNPENALANSGFTVLPLSLEANPSSHRYFEADVFEDFLSTVIWVSDIQPRIHDATCLALTMRLRRGKRSNDLFRTNHVFVTRNTTYARRARQYCIQSKLLSEGQEPPVIHQRELATVAWLRTGLDAEGSIPRASLVASCERVLRLRPEVTEAVAAKLRQVTTPEKIEQFELLLFDQRSLRKLADTTLNDERVVTAENAEQMLELMRRATAEEERLKYEKEREEELKRREGRARKERAKNAALMSEKDAEIERKSQEHRDALAELGVAESKIRQDELRRAESIRGIIGLINRNSIWLDRIATFILVCVGIIGLIYDSIWSQLLGVGAVLGLYYIAMEILQKRKYGLGDLLSWHARGALKKRLGAAHLDVGLEDFSISNGKIRWKQDSA